MWLGSSLIESCEHADVLVDYDHSLGKLSGVPVTELKASDPAKTRPIITLLNPRCGTCGAKLTLRSLTSRIRRGGDLYDPRFAWS